MDSQQFMDADTLNYTLGFLPRPGLLLAAGSGSRANVMTVGWATFGVVWNRPVCMVMVRPTRYTFSLIEESGAFTLNVPAPDMGNVLDFCGNNSGRDVDKIKALGIAVSPAGTVEGIALTGCPLTYECHVVGRSDIPPDMLAEDVLAGHYRYGTRAANYHRLYIAEIRHVRRRGKPGG